VKFGLQIPHFHLSSSADGLPDWLTQVAIAADEGPYDSLWLMDHFFQLGGEDWLSPVEAPMLEAYSALGYVSARTRRIRLGALVSPPPYRHPGVLAKTVTTLDVLSRGRVILGVGAGWYEEEARGLGIPFPTLAARFEQLRELILICRQMWRGDRSAYAGRHFQLERPVNEPRPVQGDIPILIGGSGPRKTLRPVAELANACNVGGTFYQSTDDIRRCFEVLRAHCESVGRPYESIERTVLDTFDVRDASSIEEIGGRCRDMARVGVQTIIFNIPHAFDRTTVARLATEVVEPLAAI
jgi:F420-dependent oxidoreductase-like protein